MEKVNKMTVNTYGVRNGFYRPEKGDYALMFLDENGEPEKSRTKQADKDQTDIHNIIRTYDRTGLVQHVAKGVAQYGDFTNVNEFQESLNFVIAAQQSFSELPSTIRAKFNNDPGLFFEFATNPENLDKMVEMGLAKAPTPEPAPMRVEVVNTPVSE